MRKFNMRVSYETNRLVDSHLLAAYEKLISPVKKQIQRQEEYGHINYAEKSNKKLMSG